MHNKKKKDCDLISIIIYNKKILQNIPESSETVA